MGIIEVKNLSFQFSPEKEWAALHDISFSVEKGELFSVIGRNGSGKTTLSRHLNALYLPQEGTVTVCGLDTSDANNTSEIRKKCGMVFAPSSERFLSSTVLGEVSFAAKCAGAGKNEAEEKGAETLKYTGMSGRENVRLSSLTEYEAFCVQLAAVLTAEPEILVLDDAALRLSGEDMDKYSALLTKLKEDGKTLLLFTARYEEAAMADRVLLLDKGCMTACGSPREVLTDREALRKAGIELPFSLKVYYDLLDSDIKLEKPPLNMRELVEEICL